jgi:hypothetical protein
VFVKNKNDRRKRATQRLTVRDGASSTFGECFELKLHALRVAFGRTDIRDLSPCGIARSSNIVHLSSFIVNGQHHASAKMHNGPANSA